MNSVEIIKLLPYTKPFLFVDELTEISENGISGNYTFQENEFFYKGHFKENPITPGVILTETMAQIGVVCLGIFLLKEKLSENTLIQYYCIKENFRFLINSNFSGIHPL